MALDVDLALGLAALAIGAALLAFSAPLARLLREGDEHWREQHPWTEAFEPRTALLARDDGRYLVFRAWLVISAAGFLAVGTALAARGA